jgi:predicted nucleic acid-binding protein
MNTIVKFELESRAKDLKGLGKSYEEIALILSKETKQTITKSAVFRYFESNHKAALQAIEKSDKLKAKVAEAEISTINERLEDISFLLELAKQARDEGDIKVAVLAMKARTEALNSLDERLGKLKAPINSNTINILNIQEKIQGARESFRNAIFTATTAVSEREDFGSIN